MEKSEEIAKLLLSIKAVTLSMDPPFTYTSGIKSPIYCDNRLMISYPSERQIVIDSFKQVISHNNLQFDVIAGTATAAIPWAAFLAADLGKPMVYVRSKPKGHGAGKQVEGTMAKGARVLIVEDLISTGGSSLGSVSACKREFEANVIGVLAIFTYEMQRAARNFQEEGMPLYTLSNFSTLVDVAVEQDYLESELKHKVLAWNQDPENWTP